MFNIDNIINTTVQLEPWRHQLIDNFFIQGDFKKINRAAESLLTVYRDQTITSHDCLTIAQVYHVIGEEVFNILLDANSSLLKNINQVVQHYPNHRKFNKYISMPTFHILPPNYPPQKIHDESYDKTVSIVVYLHPELSTGTALFKNNTQDSFVNEVEWRQNRSMLFCGEQNVTWHDFYSKDSPRVTLNFFLRELRSKIMLENEVNLYWKDVDGPKIYIPKSIPQDKIELLTSGILYNEL
jgi:hypothetical protein